MNPIELENFRVQISVANSVVMLTALATMASFGYAGFPEIDRWVWVVDSVLYGQLLAFVAFLFAVRPLSYLFSGGILAVGWMLYAAFRFVVPMVWPPYITLMLIGTMLWSLYKIGVFVLVDEDAYKKSLDSDNREKNLTSKETE